LFTPTLEAYDWSSFIGSITVAPSIAVKLSEQFYLGATFNINYGFFLTEQWAGSQVIPLKPTPVYLNFGQQTLDVKGWGFGATFGALVKPADWISLGVTFRTQSKIKLSGTTEIEDIDGLSPYVGGIPIATTSDTTMSVASPMWLAGGVALMPLDKLTLTFDVQYTNWAKLDEVAVTFDDAFWAANVGEEAALLLNWCDKTQIRGGVEYDFGNFALRGGYYYDPAPAPDETLNILVPSFTYNSVSGGFGYKSGGFKLDFCLEYLKGKQRTIEPSGDNLPGIYDLKILAPSFSLTISF
jgi:long-chain fatty acid transport protein